jgi:TPR repeat protein
MLKKLLFAALLCFATTVYAGFDEGYSALQNKDYATAIKEWEPIAKKGDATAQHNLGVMYEEGLGVKIDLKKALFWYRKAGENGYANSQINLGIMYANGTGIKKNDVTAVYWYRKAAEQGNVDGQNKLADMYGSGNGVEKDLAEAAKLFRKAAYQGSAYAQYSLGFQYRRGQGVIRDEGEARKWLSRAADQGYKPAIKELEDIKDRQLRALQEQLARERKQQEEEQEEERRRIYQVGQKICQDINITTSFGSSTYPHVVTITGFIENNANSKIQIRISSLIIIQGSAPYKPVGSSMDRINGDVVYERGAIIWDESSNWKQCN